MSASGPDSQNAARAAKDLNPLGLGDMMRFSKFLLERCGLHFSESRRTELEHGIRHAFASSACATLDEFYDLLVNSQTGSVEMDLLVNSVTVSETHFFRDTAQFNALVTSVLPEIIKRKSSLRTLRIWSAGCASGEEPYSLAMILRDVLPDIENWSITILATDINTTLLERAHVGSYGSWAFREERAAQMRPRFFQPASNRFELNHQIKRMVTFNRLNLAESNYPSYETNTMMMDLIVCRNVTIYFPEAVTRQVVGRFYNALVDGGWLMVGHSEPSIEIYKQFQPRNFPDTVLYQRMDNPKPITGPLTPTLTPAVAPPLAQRSAVQATPTISRMAHLPKTNPDLGKLISSSAVPEEKPEETLQHARELLEFGRDQDALTMLEKLVRAHPSDARAYALMGQAQANRGAWTESEKCCRRAVEIDKLALPAYYTLGLVLQHQKKIDEAVDVMKKVVYLDRNHILGHYNLAGLYREQGLFPNAQKSLDNALNLLRNLPAEQMISDSGGISVSRLRDAIVRQQQTMNKV